MSRFERNVHAQPALLRAALAAPAPAWLRPPQKSRRTYFVGVGTNHHAARIAAWLWSRAGFDARAVHAHDFVALPHRPARGDLGVFLSHRGSRSYTVEAERMARRAGAETVAVCGAGAVWRVPRRVETCPLEDTGAYTKSLTTTLAWLLRWTGKPELLAPLRRASRSLAWGPAFPKLSRQDDLILLGDGLREWIAAETALKLLETAHLRPRVYGLEEFLHGPHISAGRDSVVVAFSAPGEPRWAAARAWARGVGARLVDVRSSDWLAQIIWGQRLTAAACRALGISPDLLRADEPRYAKARAELSLGRGLPRQ